jgi:hypothetical protein
MAVASALDREKGWRQARAVGPLEQMVQVETGNVRMRLVQVLSETKGKEATAALARRAVFDLAPEVRQAAVEALKGRSRGDARPVLLGGLRYPWVPAAMHAAEALVALEDRAAVKELRALLPLPDPDAPFRNKDKRLVVRELVRVNHLGNCLLCHAASFNPRDPVRGLVPTPGEPLPVVYYASRRGTFVRADVTYLRQDFSVMQKVDRPNRWPEVQRFDYVVRTRELTAQEAPRVRPAAGKATASGHRKALLFALAGLGAAPEEEAGGKGTRRGARVPKKAAPHGPRAAAGGGGPPG